MDEGQWENGCHPGITGFLVQLDLAQRVHKAGDEVAIRRLPVWFRNLMEVEERQQENEPFLTLQSYTSLMPVLKPGFSDWSIHGFSHI